MENIRGRYLKSIPQLIFIFLYIQGELRDMADREDRYAVNMKYVNRFIKIDEDDNQKL